MSSFDPILAIKKWWLADGRPGLSRMPGAMLRLVNLFPNITGEERVRAGYSAYASTDGGSTPGQDMPTGFEVLKVASIQNPVQADVHFKFSNNSGQTVKMNPWWQGATEETTDLLINESKTFTPAAGSITSTHITVTGSDALGLSQVADYYKGWELVDVTVGTAIPALYISGYSYSSAASGTSVFTILNTDLTTTTAAITDQFSAYRNFHDNPTFAPSYNNDLANPIAFNVENSIIRFSGGQSSAAGNRGIWINPQLTRTFFPDSTSPFTFQNTYISERELKASSALSSQGIVLQAQTSDISVLVNNSTYWIAVAPVYDGFQIGQLTKFEDYTAYAAVNDSDISFTPLNNGTSSLTASVIYVSPGVYSYTVALYVTGSDTFPLTPSGTGLATSTGFYDGWTLTNLKTGHHWTIPSGGHHYSATLGGDTHFDWTFTGNSTGLSSESLTDSWQLSNPGAINTHAVNNYIKSGNLWNFNMKLSLSVAVGSMNKRITGYAVYCAVDTGDTRVQGRQSDYFFQNYVSIVTAGNPDGWTVDTLGYYNATSIVNQNSILAQGNDFQTDSGYVISSTDIMYAYSTEEIVNGRRMLANAYVTSESAVDRSNVFTNPIGGNSVIGNDGLIQPDAFSNESGVYRLRVDPTVGTQINGIAQTGVDEFLVLKDRGCVLCRILLAGNIPDFMLTVISHEVGATTVNCWAKDDQNRIYFPSFFDVYRYEQGQLSALIERPDKNDWLDTYRNLISNVDKQNASITYLPEFKCIIFQFANQATAFEQKQYVFFPDYGWREIRFAESSRVPTVSFKYFAKLSIGHTLGITSSSPTVKRLFWLYSGAMAQYLLTYIDGSTAIAPYFDTGDFVIEDGRDIRFNKVNILKSFDTPALGTLDCNLYLDSVLVRNYPSQSKSDLQLVVNGLSSDIRIGYTMRFEYNSNISPEHLSATVSDNNNQLQFNGLLLYGDTIPHQRVSESSGSLSTGGYVTLLGTIGGKREVTITTANTPQTFTFDLPFTQNYTGSLGVEPAYRFNIDSAHPVVGGVEDATTDVETTIISRTLTTITLSAAGDNTIVRFSIA